MHLINFKKSDVLQALTIVSDMVERKNTLPILSNLLLAHESGNFSITSSDLETQIVFQTKSINCNYDFKVTVNSKKFLDIVRSCEDHEEIKIEKNEQKIVIKSGKNRYNLQTLPAEDFPEFKIEDEYLCEINILQSRFKKMIVSIDYAMGNQDIRYCLNGALFEITDKKLTIVATDGHRLATIAENIEEISENYSIIVPRKMMLMLKKIIDHVDENMVIKILKNKIIFQINDYIFSGKLIDGKYPDYHKVIPNTNNRPVGFNKENLIKSIKRVSVLSNEKIKVIRLLISEKTAKLLCTNNEQEESEEYIDIEYESNPMDIGYNSNYLLDGLNTIESESIILNFGETNNSTTLITTEDEPSFKYVVMPMRI